MASKSSRFQRFRQRAEALMDTGGPAGEIPKWRRFLHFCVLVWRSFVVNRCPARASALAYATLLALIPMLAVAMSITSTFLKGQGEKRIYEFIGEMVASLTPPAPLTPAASATPAGPTNNVESLPPEPNLETNTVPAAGSAGTPAQGAPPSGQAAAPAPQGKNQDLSAARHAVARWINQFIQNTRSGALGVTGSVLLIFAGISLLSRIETTFNDIWGVARGRNWFMRVILYWGVLTLAPLLIVLAVGLTTGPHLETTRRLLASLPVVGNFLLRAGFQLLPILIVCLALSGFYMLMPNTKVNWRAALAGGVVAGLLFHLNNAVSVLYVSRVVSNSKIYGSLGLVPVFMIGLYFSWLILLLGAQVSYAFQNRGAYLEEKQIETINQRGREFIALRIMTLLAARFSGGQTAAGIEEMAASLCVPSRLIQQILRTLVSARLAVETAGKEPAFLPARSIETITCHDVLLAMRASQGQELATRDEPIRAEVYGEFQRIQEAERQAASSITLLAMINRNRRIG